jgi:hypothetical protein
MRKPANPDPASFEALFKFDPHSLPIEQKLLLMAELRRQPDASALMDRAMLDQLDFKHKSLLE